KFIILIRNNYISPILLGNTFYYRNSLAVIFLICLISMQHLKNAVCKNSRARGMFRFFGANRTG
ncbi:MAG: hypothetical protein SO070_06300, partial [Ruminococcus bromii]